MKRLMLSVAVLVGGANLVAGQDLPLPEEIAMPEDPFVVPGRPGLGGKDAAFLAEVVLDGQRPLRERMEACRKLRSIGPAAASQASRLVRELTSVRRLRQEDPYLDSPNRLTEYRTALVEAIGAMGPAAAEQAAPALCRTFADAGNRIAQNRHALRSYDHAVIQHELFTSMIEADMALCAASAKALASFGPKSSAAVPMLVRALQLRNSLFADDVTGPAVERQVELVEALGRIGSHDALPVLNQLRVSASEPELRDAAAEAIAAIEGDEGDGGRAAAPRRPADPSPRARRASRGF